MRVVAGSARGRLLTCPDGLGVRPTSDRVREATFNALASRDAIVDARVLDLFAGSGALSIEALSRGAAQATLVEPDRGARACIEANLVTTGFTGSADVVSGSAESFLHRHVASDAGEPFDLVLCDPPYSYDRWDGLWPLLPGVTAPNGVVVAESDRDLEVPPEWELMRSRRYGGTVVSVLIRSADGSRHAGDHL